MPRPAGRNCDDKIRVLAVYRMLLRGKKMSCAQILNELEAIYGITANRKTIYSDIKSIDRIQPIKVLTGPHGGYCVHNVLEECE